jgi:hypothetical protein
MRVECLSCGCVADRILKPDDQRTPADILARGRCGQCHITMKWGDVRISFDGGAWIQAKPPRPRRPITARPQVHETIDPMPEGVHPDFPPPPQPELPDSDDDDPLAAHNRIAYFALCFLFAMTVMNFFLSVLEAEHARGVAVGYYSGTE